MAASFVEYIGDNATVLFTSPAVDENVASLVVEVDGVVKTGGGTDYTYDNALNQVTFVAAPAQDAVIHIYRSTSTDSPAVDFINSAILNESILDKAFKQAIFAIHDYISKVGVKIGIFLNPADENQFDATSKRIKNVTDPTAAQDAATKNYVDGRKVTDLTAPTGDFDMNSNKIINVTDPVAAQDAATKNYIDTREISDLTAPTGNFSMNSNKITSVTDPTVAQDAATKNYVDSQLGTGESVVEAVTSGTRTITMPADNGKVISNEGASGDITVQMPDTAVSTEGMWVTIINMSPTYKITIDPGGSSEIFMQGGARSPGRWIAILNQGGGLRLKHTDALAGSNWTVMDLIPYTILDAEIPLIIDPFHSPLMYEYDFAVSGGAQGTFQLGKIPDQFVISHADYRVKQNFTSAGNLAVVKLGHDTTDDFFIDSTVVSDAIWGTGAFKTTKRTGRLGVTASVGQDVNYLASGSTQNILMTVGTEDLTAGRVYLAVHGFKQS